MNKNKFFKFYYIYVLIAMSIVLFYGYKNFDKLITYFKFDSKLSTQIPDPINENLVTSSYENSDHRLLLQDDLLTKLSQCESECNSLKKQISDRFEQFNNYRSLLQNLIILNENFYNETDYLEPLKLIIDLIKPKNDIDPTYAMILMKLEILSSNIAEYKKYKTERKPMKIRPVFINKLLSNWIKIETTYSKVDLSKYYIATQDKLKELNVIFCSSNFMRLYSGN